MRLLLCGLIGLTLYAQRINCGGPAYTDTAGQEWKADQYFTGGFVTTATVPASADQFYSTKRYGDFVYRIPVPDGVYSVTLYLIENSVMAAGQRSFGVNINGTAVLTAYDEVAEIGFLVPAKKTFAARAENGTGIRIQFSTQLRSAFVNAIEVQSTALWLQVDAYQVACQAAITPCTSYFALARIPYGGVMVFLNGRLLYAGPDGQDYAVLPFNDITLASPTGFAVQFNRVQPGDGDVVMLVYTVR